MTSAARQPAAIEIAAAKFCKQIAAAENKKPISSNKADLIAIWRHSKKKGNAATKRPANKVAGSGTAITGTTLHLAIRDEREDCRRVLHLSHQKEFHSAQPIVGSVHHKVLTLCALVP